MKCQICRNDTPEDDIYVHQSRSLCEDCYMKAMNPVDACNPVAVRAAISLRENMGQKGQGGLTPLQQRIYEFIKDNGKVTAIDVTTTFNITEQDLSRIIGTLRHCELVKGLKEEDKVYIVPWSS